MSMMQIFGDSNGQDLTGIVKAHTCWTYASQQALYVFLDTVTELFLICSDSTQGGKSFIIDGTKAPGAAVPHEEIVIARTLASPDATVPVSLAATPGFPTVEDIYDIRAMRANLAADALESTSPGEVFVAAGFSGVAPVGSVYAHLAVSPNDGPRNTSAMGHGTIPGGFEGTVGSPLMGSFEDATVAIEFQVPGLPPLQTFGLPISHTIGGSGGGDFGAGSPANPSRFPAGTRFSILVGGSKAVGASLNVNLFKVTT